MNIFVKSLFAALALSAPTLSGAAQQVSDTESRIMWDVASRQVIFPSGNYSRLIPLQDGRLLAIAEIPGGIGVVFSSDSGATWTEPRIIARGEDRLPYAVPDVIQLSDGTILAGFNPRPSSPYSEERRFGIRTLYSTDGGETWSEPVHAFDASHLWTEGCWEPSFLELPDGEVHLYFANEYPYPDSGDQQISLIRSNDKGRTWSAPECVSYRAGHRDGMPSAIITDAGEIVVIIEDNGFPRGFMASTVRCDVDRAWRSCPVYAESGRRSAIFAGDDSDNRQYISAAPYIRRLRTGETIASWQGDHFDRKGFPEARFGMYVAVGDRDARNFTQVSAPFDLPTDSHALWNSINVGFGNDVFALASIGSPTQGNAITLMKGYAVNAIDVPYAGTDAASALVMGFSKTKNRAEVSFTYDADGLYVAADVTDSEIIDTKTDNDGVYVYLDPSGTPDTKPSEGRFRLFFDVDGSVAFARGSGRAWSSAEVPEGLTETVVRADGSYRIDGTIPWSALGLQAAPLDRTVRCTVEIRDRRTGASLVEKVPAAENRSSVSWLPLVFGPSGAGLSAPVAAEAVRFRHSGRTLSVDSMTPVVGLEAYSTVGTLVARSASAQLSLPSAGLFLCSATLSDGRRVSAKVVTE
ncbi:MAG: exo-alpha-sialidase [Muribaculaceae bacterium]|nr:exo-alpha-sialidase [Muribaculaceae bacterium]